MFPKLLAEFLGTAMLILLGDGVVANVTLNKSGMKGAGPIQITLAWGLAVLMPVICYGAISGAHFNPAVSIGLAIAGKFDWALVVPYIIAQVLGGCLGGIVVYFFFKCQFDATDDPGTKLGVFSTAPSVRSTANNFFCEVVGTFVLVFVILMNRDSGAATSGVASLFTFGLIVSIGMSLGGTTGYAINPARDAGPRIAHMIVLPKEDHNWGYGWIPVVAPIVGGIVAALLYLALKAPFAL
ncbi:MAG: aquaporin family protein [Clostridia bacterium]|nr:aquaporin family protein [Clostridia bacterium]MBQ3651770.1 aquaporin family protein [Clostridia bacterium]MBQ9323897.1 aquaporin family protein [Clostridia bacterium]MBQ9923055.1 aquaporin family protein [Clostridia bacterium]MBR0421729.1 aquaporin family protein [Clostridia bacterium]